MRTNGLAGAVATAVLGMMWAIAAVSGARMLSILAAYGVLVAGLVTVLLCTRYLARLTCTEQRKSRAAILEISDQFSAGLQVVERLANDQKRIPESLIDTVSGMLNDVQADAEKQLGYLTTSIDRRFGSSARHLTKTVRDGTRQIEALVQLHASFTDTKLPMPSTGGFAIDAQALGHLLALVDEQRPKRILELGSGTSSVWLGYLCRAVGGKVISLDHMEEYFNLTRTAIGRHGLLDQVEVRLAPLEPTECDGKVYEWYSLGALEGINDIDLVLIDGPPASTGPEARYPALPKITNILAPNATVVLDDAHRQDEADIVQAWLEYDPDFRQVEQGTSRLAVLRKGT